MENNFDIISNLLNFLKSYDNEENIVFFSCGDAKKECLIIQAIIIFNILKKNYKNIICHFADCLPISKIQIMLNFVPLRNDAKKLFDNLKGEYLYDQYETYLKILFKNGLNFYKSNFELMPIIMINPSSYFVFGIGYQNLLQIKTEEEIILRKICYSHPTYTDIIRDFKMISEKKCSPIDFKKKIEDFIEEIKSNLKLQFEKKEYKEPTNQVINDIICHMLLHGIGNEEKCSAYFFSIIKKYFKSGTFEVSDSYEFVYKIVKFLSQL
jgi:hypothetical protein